jgi:hypothetical protein
MTLSVYTEIDLLARPGSVRKNKINAEGPFYT